MARGIFIAIECALPPAFLPPEVAAYRLFEPVISEMHWLEIAPSPPGTIVVARFACRVAGMLLLGVKLMGREDGNLGISNVVSGAGNGPDTRARGLLIEDERLRDAILAAATAALDYVHPPTEETPSRHRGRRAGGR